MCSKCDWDNQDRSPAAIGYCTLHHGFRCSSDVSRPQTVCLQAFSWPPSDQHMVISGTTTKLDFIRTRNRYPLPPPMNSGLTPLVSLTAMA
ncbi:uncharacterized protein TNCV_1278471 [Trichonephila clavipes]|nr:uncharacterized protein TNCV_1278471 [Trichonephila clavipes]